MCTAAFAIAVRRYLFGIVIFICRDISDFFAGDAPYFSINACFNFDCYFYWFVFRIFKNIDCQGTCVGCEFIYFSRTWNPACCTNIHLLLRIDSFKYFAVLVSCTRASLPQWRLYCRDFSRSDPVSG